MFTLFRFANQKGIFDFCRGLHSLICLLVYSVCIYVAKFLILCKNRTLSKFFYIHVFFSVGSDDFTTLFKVRKERSRKRGTKREKDKKIETQRRDAQGKQDKRN